MVSTSDYESTDPSPIPDEESRRTAHPAVHPPKRIGRVLGTQVKLEEGKLEIRMSQWSC